MPSDAVLGLDLPLRAARPLASIQIGSSTSLLPGTSDDTRLWVLTDAGPVAIDPTTNQVVQRIPVPPSADGYGLAVSDGSVWLSAYDDGSVDRYDARTGKREATIPVEDASCVAAGAGMVWACEHLLGRVVRIDPKRNAVVSAVTVGSPGSGGPGEIVWSSGRLWVQVGNDGTVVGVDPKSAKTTTIPLGANDPGPIAVGDGAIWVTDWDPAGLLMVDPSGQRRARLTPVDGETSQALVEHGSVWAGFLAHSSNTPGALISVDPATGRIVDGVSLPDGQATQVFEAFGSVWVVLGEQGILERFAPDVLSMPS